MTTANDSADKNNRKLTRNILIIGLVGRFQSSVKDQINRNVRGRVEFSEINRAKESQFVDATIIVFCVYEKDSGYDYIKKFKKTHHRKTYIVFDVNFSESRVSYFKNVMKIDNYYSPPDYWTLGNEICNIIKKSVKTRSIGDKYDTQTLSGRLDSAIAGLRATRINSIGDIIVELENISASLKSKSSNGKKLTKTETRVSTLESLKILSKLYDVLDEPLAKIVVAGAVGVIVSNAGGALGSVVYTITIAAAFGQKSFDNAVNKVAQFWKILK